nr:hypothetical protein [Paucilactobacillus hokkaidonensis]
MKPTVKEILTYHDGRLTYNDHLIFMQQKASPILFLGRGNAKIDMYRGNFDINDQLTDKVPLFISQTDVTEAKVELTFSFETEQYLKLTAKLDQSQRLNLTFDLLKSDWNRFWIRLAAITDEKIYGCGEQLSYFNLRGRHFPLWTSEPVLAATSACRLRKSLIWIMPVVITIIPIFLKQPLFLAKSIIAMLIHFYTQILIFQTPNIMNYSFGGFLKR